MEIGPKILAAGNPENRHPKTPINKELKIQNKATYRGESVMSS
jgi:hypothetical protein